MYKWKITKVPHKPGKPVPVILLPNHMFCIYEAFEVNIFPPFPAGSGSYSIKGEFSKTLVLTKRNKYVTNVIFTPENGKILPLPINHHPEHSKCPEITIPGVILINP